MRRILLCGMENLRDLGGYPLAGRGSERFTRWGSLYRGDLPKQVTQADRQHLRELGITTVVDLRSKEEIERKPDPLAQEPGIRYLHCPLAGDGRVPAPDEVPLSYMEMADGTGQMAGALRAIAEAPQAVLFHCTAGKDRTGVVAALLLWLAGVSEAVSGDAGCRRREAGRKAADERAVRGRKKFIFSVHRLHKRMQLLGPFGV